MRLGSNLIEIFGTTSEPLATHPRLVGMGKFSTQEQHYPDKKLGIKRFEVKAAQDQAMRIGPETSALVESLIAVDYPLLHLRRIQGIVRLASSKQLSVEALEYGCKQALTFNKPRFHFVKACAEYFQKNGCRLMLVKPERQRQDIYLHGDPVNVPERPVIGGQS